MAGDDTDGGDPASEGTNRHDDVDKDDSTGGVLT